MNRLARTLITGTALMILPLTSAYAGGSTSTAPSYSNILNGQVNLNASVSTLNANTANVSGDASGQSVAGGNIVQVVTMNDTSVNNSQIDSNTVVLSKANVNVGNIGGNVSYSSQAVCNSADVSTDPTTTVVNSYQECSAIDPSSTLNANVSGVGGSVALTGSAVGNTFSEDTNAINAPVNTAQVNTSFVQSTVNANVSNVAGSVSATSAAIGNNAQIIHY